MALVTSPGHRHAHQPPIQIAYTHIPGGNDSGHDDEYTPASATNERDDDDDVNVDARRGSQNGQIEINEVNSGHKMTPRQSLQHQHSL